MLQGGDGMSKQETYDEAVLERKAYILAELADRQPHYAAGLALGERYRFSTLTALMALEKEGVIYRLPLAETNMHRLWALTDKAVTA